MKYSSALFQDKFHSHSNGKRGGTMNIGTSLVLFVLTSLLLLSTFTFYFLNSPNPLSIVLNQGHNIIENRSQKQDQQYVQTLKVTSSKPHKEEKKCDLFKGDWVPSLEGLSSYYTNSSCTTIPDSKNCFKHGREDSDFLNWKWKPHECDLPRFDPTIFLNMVRGKKMAFIGDSVARNHVDSLLCILSQEEIPKNIYKDSEDRYRKWYFPKYDFTLKMIWSRFLIVGEERMVNGSGTSIFDMQLDKIDYDWAKEFPYLDYAIISDGHWFFRVMYLHIAGKLVGCLYCQEPNVKHYNSDYPFRMAFHTAFKHINTCNNCRKTLTLIRTFAPAHFENGGWNNGGYCNKTSPMNEGEVNNGMFEWQLRNIQMEEFERARNEGKKKGQRFEVIDVSRAMIMRPDGHPGEHWGNKWMKGYNDCTHWCMPGPIDLWSELLLAVLKRSSYI
ncbi:PREDICTED: protein ALTERED XYLOGLUCAN 4-like [Lupinus angustifolius]|uniref:protein ALTERED XYLOGLUCAN 4-like n=1 Tax=Lupinus angustifolius TaxID=3871 RepID=UPI00092EB757|nr:PREDICTED: protein ALTERED XYLOGLUCAN 4-like [Lupinus angustifolius]